MLLAAATGAAADNAAGNRPAGAPGTPGPAAMEPAAPDMAVPRFTIRRFIVRNSTLLSADELSAAVAPYEGPDKDLGDVQKAMEALEEGYRDRGFSSVSVYLPEQELKDGEVVLIAVEGRFSRIDVDGNRFFTRDNIERSFPTLKAGGFPRVHEISRNLRVVNENPAKRVTLQLLGGDREDEVIARLKVADEKQWKAGLTGDNSGTGQTGDYRLGILLQHFNLHDRDHVASFQYVTSPDHADSVNSVSASYRVPLYALGDSLDLFAGYSDVNADLAVSGYSLKTNGKGVVTGLRYNHALMRYAEYSQNLVAGFDYRLYDNQLNSADSSSNLMQKSRQLLHPLSLTYNGTYALEQGEASLTVGGAYNIPWGSYGEKKDFPEGTAADYFVLRYGTSLVYAAPADLQIRLLFNGQYSSRNLVSYEQFGLGGANAGRGYVERAAAGTSGCSGTAEVYSPDIARLLSLKDTQFRLVAFYDDGYVGNPAPSDGGTGRIRLASAGGGFRFSLAASCTVSTDVGVTLNSIGGVSGGDVRAHVKAAFIY